MRDTGRISALIITLLLGLFSSVFSQQSDTIQLNGTVMSAEDDEAVIGANVVIKGSDPLVGTITDLEGYFEIKVPYGSDVLISYVGYTSVVIRFEQILGEKRVNIALQLEAMEEVIISASSIDQVVAESPVSVQKISIEETQAFPGGFNDVGRLAQNFAGIQKKDDSSNEIVVRGNSPNMVLWRVDGVDIPNPNHFSSFGTSGGNLSVLNTNTMLGANFYTGAFPAQYGNVLGGAFDIRLRNGSSERWQGMAQIGFNGLELMAEGPLYRSRKVDREVQPSILFNYRNSNMALLNAMGVIDFDVYLGVPTFNDFTIKVNIPNSKFGDFSVFGIAGFSDVTTSASKIIAKQNTSELARREAIDEGQDLRYGSRMGVVGINHKIGITEKSFLKSSLAYTYTNSYTFQDTLNISYQPFRKYQEDFAESKVLITSEYIHYINAKYRFQSGLSYRTIGFNLTKDLYSPQFDIMAPVWRNNGFTGQQQSWLTWKYTSPSQVLEITGGLHQTLFTLNSDLSIEPRINAAIQITRRNSITLAAGKHTQLIPITEYFSPVGQLARDLEMMKSIHYVLGHQWQASDRLIFKQEVYYQDLYDIPVSANLSNSWSMINYGVYENNGNKDVTLVNDGKGRNYGIDLTLEMKETNGYYGLLTSSIFRSEYRGSDQIWRNTAWDSRFMTNLVLGKRLEAGPGTLDINLKQNWTGGLRYAPILVDESLELGRTIRDFENDFSAQYPNYYKLDIRFGYLIPHKRFSHEMALDLQNITFRKNVLYQTYSPATGSIKTVHQLGFIPVFQYRFRF